MQGLKRLLSKSNVSLWESSVTGCRILPVLQDTFSSSAQNLRAIESQDSSEENGNASGSSVQRTHLMMINGVVTGISGGNNANFR